MQVSLHISIRFLTLLASLVMLSACVTQRPIVQVPQHLFSDQAFTSPKQTPDAAAIFAPTAEMKQFIAKEILTQIRSSSHQRALFNALYTKAQLKLEYDSSYTRNAAETFSARSGNCLSLVIMTAAIAKEMGMDISYQSVITPETWSRNGGLYFNVGHVNIVLGKRHFDDRNHLDKNHQMTIDFYPPEEIAGQRTLELEEKTIVAMYFNNRAAESMSSGDLNQAYHWARAAVSADPTYAAAYNTLGVVYLRHKNDELAYNSLEAALKLDPTSTVAMSNMIQAMEQTNRLAEAQAMQVKLASRPPYPPFHFFKLGMKAMEAQDYNTAKRWFERELDRAPDYHEFHFWLGMAHLKLGELKAAEVHLTAAKSNSTSQQDHSMYSSKLERFHAAQSKFQ